MALEEDEPCVLDTQDPDDTTVVEVERRSFLPGILTTVPLAVRKPFQAVGTSRRRKGGVVKTLGPKRPKQSAILVSKFLSGVKTNFATLAKQKLDVSPQDESGSDEDDDDESDEDEKEPEFKPHEPLVLYEPTAEEAANGAEPIQVPPILCQFLRPHQREGVQFVFDCVYGSKDFGGEGAILADDMGLGKTLQSITVMYSMLKNVDAKRLYGAKTSKAPKPTGTRDRAVARRCVVVCPCSLVKNWQDEFEKWINSRAKEPKDRVECMALAEQNRKTVEAMLDQFLSPQSRYDVLVVSYETFRAQAGRFVKRDAAVAKMPHAPAQGCVDLVICDEAHRLKNADAQTSTALASLRCRRRVLLSGTPMQNNLIEFFAMVNFTNPGLLGTKEAFAKRYERPVLRGREPDATEAETRKAAERQKELSDLANHFIIRRMNRLNAQHLPPKLTQVVCCRLTDCQSSMYKYLIKERETEAALEGSIKDSLGYVQLLQKVCNHPTILGASGGGQQQKRSKRDAELAAMLPGTQAAADPADDPNAPRGRNGRVLARHTHNAPKAAVDPGLSGKMRVLHALMKQLFAARKERIVVISVFMTTLDLIEDVCRQEGWPSCKLGGSTPAKTRKRFNDEFNDPKSGYFAFLLSSKAGGCGLNLIGGSRLVMFDLDWNPATDKQAAARCWRDGQKLPCFTYRFVSTGTLEERMLQRQLAKEGLQNVIQDEDQVNSFAADDLKRLFLYRNDTVSDLHDELQCAACKGKHAAKKVTNLGARGDNHLSETASRVCADGLRSDLASLDCAQPFLTDYDLSTIDKENHPDALRLAKKPLDLRSVLAKLDARQYPKISDVLKDLRAVARLARRIFRDKPHPVHKAADAFEDAVNDLWPNLAPRLFDANAADADSDNTCAGPPDASARREHAPDDDDPVSTEPFKKQLYPLPKEEDLNNWSHHSSIATVADPVFRKALRATPDAVSFVFGMYQDWDLISAAEALEKEQVAKPPPEEEKQDDDAVSDDAPPKKKLQLADSTPAPVVPSAPADVLGSRAAAADTSMPPAAGACCASHAKPMDLDSSSSSGSSSSGSDSDSSSSDSDSDDDDDHHPVLKDSTNKHKN